MTSLLTRTQPKYSKMLSFLSRHDYFSGWPNNRIWLSGPLSKVWSWRPCRKKRLLREFGTLWASDIWWSVLDYSKKFQKSDSTFDVDWLLHQLEKEVKLAEQVFGAVCNCVWSSSKFETNLAHEFHLQPKVSASCNNGTCFSLIIWIRNRTWKWILLPRTSPWFVSREITKEGR